MLVTEEVGVEPTDALLFLALDTECRLVIVEPEPSRPLRRLTAIAREGSRRRPLVALSSDGTSTSWCRQAGVSAVHRVEDAAQQASELLREVQTGTWVPCERGELAELPDCDVAQARALLDAAARAAPGQQRTPGRVPAGVAGELLAAYRIPTHLYARSGSGGQAVLILEEHPDLGPQARVSLSRAGLDPDPVRLLPLTDRDADELVQSPGLSVADPGPAADALLRAARLMDDQADVVRIELPIHRSAGTASAAAVWTGAQRGTDDDPFLRRLPARPTQAQ
jgi:hypothetical protein